MNRVTNLLLVLVFMITFVNPAAAATRTAANSPSPEAIAASIIVNSHEDTQANDGVCTLREAILNANADDQSGSTDCAAGNGNDEITFNLSDPDTILLSSPLPAITGILTIQGPGANTLSVSGNHTTSILSVNASGSLTVQGLALINGAGGNGSAISNYGSLVVSESTFVNNISSASSGAIYNDGGTLEVTASTFVGNQASSAGGAIGNYGGTATVTNSTFAANTATGPWGGGAIYSRSAALGGAQASDAPEGEATARSPEAPSAATLVVNASTFSANTAAGGGGAIGNGGAGETGGTATVQNSLLAGSLVGGLSVNCYNNSGMLTDGGYNLEDADTCGFSGTSLKNTDPKYLGLGNYGGGTQTIAVRRNSPAIDRIPSAANGCGTTLTVDQRGVARPQGAACDVGAYESDQQTGPTFTVNRPGDLPGVCGQSFCTLRQAIFSAQSYPAGTPYTINFSLAYPEVILLSSPLPTITSTLTIQGPGADKLSVSGNHTTGILIVNGNGSLTVQALALVNASSGNGAAISSYGSLVVSESTFVNNISSASSGAIYNDGGTLEVNASTFVGNQASNAGGAIGNYGGTATVTNSTFAANTATGPWGGGAIYSRSATLGGERASDALPGEATARSPEAPSAATLVVNASTFSGNTAAGGGGAIGNGGSGETGGAAALQNSVLAASWVGGLSVNCHNESGTLTDGGYNLEDADTCGFSGTSLKNTDPEFLGMGNYGGGTRTIALYRDSPAIDHIPSGANGCGTTLTVDQRGVVRPQGAACDVGAYESDQQPGPTFTVNQSGDAPGVCGQAFCTLRQAIFSAQSFPAGAMYTIDFNLSTPDAILLSSPLPTITGTLTILGPGSDRLSVSGNHTLRILNVHAGAVLNLRGLAFVNGSAANGGAISSYGSLAVFDAAFVGNVSTVSSGAIYSDGGTLEVADSTFVGNQASNAGGAIGNYGGTATVTNSTFVGNYAAGAWGGGAIYSRVAVLGEAQASDAPEGEAAAQSPQGPSAGTLLVNASTFSANTAAGGGGAIGNGGAGETGGTATVQNSLLAGSLVGGLSVNCYNNSGTLTDGGYNLEDADTCGFSGTSLKNTNPMYLGLGYYGGSTLTDAVRGNSPAINRIPSGANGCGTTLALDQRGVARPQGAACDVGAYESDQQTGPVFLVKQTNDASGLCTTSACSLRQAIFTAQTYPAGTAYTIDFNLAFPAAIVLGSSLPAITGTLIIEGPGADRMSISGNNTLRILNVHAGGSLAVRGLAFVNGSGANGGAIASMGSLVVLQSAFVGNLSSASSGAIYNSGGTLEVTASTFVNNQAYSAGGAIGNYGGAATVTNSTFSGNAVASSWGGGAIYSRAAVLGEAQASDALEGEATAQSPGGPSAATLLVNASTFSANTAEGGGGAIGNGGSGEVGGTATIQNSLLAGNLVGGLSVNCHNEGGTLTDGGYNLEDADTCGFSGTSLKNIDPRLLGLGNYGGTTLTFALSGVSPAINRIPSGVNGCGTTLGIDQRGVHRPQGDACDVGAFEYFSRLYLPLAIRAH